MKSHHSEALQTESEYQNCRRQLIDLNNNKPVDDATPLVKK